MARKYEPLDVTKSIRALKRIMKQYEQGKPLKWDGPDNLHHVVSATQNKPSYQFEHYKDQDRDFYDVLFTVAFQLGIHQGAVYESEKTDMAYKLYESLMQVMAERKQP